MSFFTSGSLEWSQSGDGVETVGRTHSKRRPMRRFASKTAKEAIKYGKNSRRVGHEADALFFGFMAAWFFAASPMRRSSLEKATYEGVVRLPSEVVSVSREMVPVIPGIRTIVCNDFNSIILPDTNATAGVSLGIVS